jgi:hypothetical protein
MSFVVSVGQRSIYLGSGLVLPWRIILVIHETTWLASTATVLM